MVKKSIKFWLPENQHQLLQVYALRHRTTMSKVLRKVVRVVTDLQIQELKGQSQGNVTEDIYDMVMTKFSG